MPGADEPSLRAQLSTFSPLLALATVLTTTADVDEILRIATTAVRSFGPLRTEAVYLDGGWWPVSGASATLPTDLREQLDALGRNGGAVHLPGVRWAWGLPLDSVQGVAGYMVVGSDIDPEVHHRFLIGMLVQQAAAALANARLHERERATAARLTTANAALQRSTVTAEQSAEAARTSLAVHERFTRVATAGEGVQGIALAVHELTGRPVTIEDRHGNPLADAGTGASQPYPKDPPARRKRLLRQLLEPGRAPVRDRGRLVVGARAGDLVLGVIALVASEGDEPNGDQLVLEHAATVLALELTHRRALAESELRLRRDLLEELLTGTDVQGARERARALDYDLDRPHRIVLVTGRSTRKDPDALFRAVRRAARAQGLGSLLVARSGVIALLSDTDGDWVKLRAAVIDELGARASCRLGVSAACTEPADFPRGHRQAQLALKMQTSTLSPDQVTLFEELGVYKLFSEVADLRSVEAYVQIWLGALLEYDAAKGSQMVETLAAYLECGGNYDTTAETLSLHRSTLRYRLQRLREISGLDLNEPDTRFNLQLATRALATVQALQGLSAY
jgi:sugar diacid utilization regulator